MAGGWGARPGPPALAAGKGASSMAGQAGLGSPLVCYCFLVSPLLIPPAPQCLLTGWQPGTVTPQTCSHPCFQRVPAMPSKTGSRASPLYLAPAHLEEIPRPRLCIAGIWQAARLGQLPPSARGSGAQWPRRPLRRRGFRQGFCVQETETNSG